MRLVFFLPQRPKSKGNSKKIVRFGARLGLIGSKPAREAEASLFELARPFAPLTPIAGPVRLDVAFVTAYPKGPAWKRQAAIDGRLYPDRRPDRGNLLKLAEDALEKAGFYEDDARVVSGLVEKVYGPEAGYRISLTRLVQAEAPEKMPRKSPSKRPARLLPW